jgi:hypothetical protein
MEEDNILESKNLSESDLYLALEDLVIYTLKRQINNIIDKNPWNEVSWAKEVCTIRFQGPRQCGHSTAITKLCKYIFKNPLIITSSASQKDFLTEKFEAKSVPDIIHLGQLHSTRGRTEYDGIIVDNASNIDAGWIEEIYRQFSRIAYTSGSFCFVFVG